MPARISDEDAATTMRDAGFEPLEPYPGSTKPWRCMHTCGAEVSPQLNAVKHGHGCRACNPRRTLTAEEATTLLRAKGMEPLEPFPGRTTPWRVRCLAGHESVITFWQRTNTRGCPLCRFDRKVTTETLRDTHDALEILKTRGLVALEPYPGATKSWAVACRSCLYLMDGALRVIRQPSWKCENCRRLSAIERHRKRSTTFGWDVIQAPGLLADKWTARHSCGFVHRIRISDIGKTGDACPACAVNGYSRLRSGFMYLLSVPALNALKVGITNFPDQRMEQLGSHFDFEELQRWGPMAGGTPPKIEQAVLSLWRTHPPDPKWVGLHGYTEMVSIAHVTPDAAVATIRQLLDQERPPFNPADYEVGPCDREEAEDLMRGHYTATLPVATRLVGLYTGRQLVGVAAFSPPFYPGVAKAVWPAHPESVIEIRRLYVLDEIGYNAESWFLARAMRQIPKTVEMVLAFSDPAVGHHGGVYRASNFVFLGTTKRSYHYEDNDRYVHKRVPWSWAKKAAPDRRPVAEAEAAKAAGLIRIDDPPKNRFAYPLSRRARKALAGG